MTAILNSSTNEILAGNILETFFKRLYLSDMYNFPMTCHKVQVTIDQMKVAPP